MSREDTRSIVETKSSTADVKEEQKLKKAPKHLGEVPIVEACEMKRKFNEGF